MEEVFDAILDFWDVHPWFKSIDPFKTFYEGNEDKRDSSAMMWFIKFCYHVDSPFFDMREEDKLDSVGASILGDKSYYKKNKKEIDFLIEGYIKTVDTAMDRQLRVWKVKMDEKTELMEKMTYSSDTWEMLEKMITSNEKLYASYEKILSNREKEKGRIKKGGGELSETDKGVI